MPGSSLTGLFIGSASLCQTSLFLPWCVRMSWVPKAELGCSFVLLGQAHPTFPPSLSGDASLHTSPRTRNSRTFLPDLWSSVLALLTFLQMPFQRVPFPIQGGLLCSCSGHHPSPFLSLSPRFIFNHIKPSFSTGSLPSACKHSPCSSRFYLGSLAAIPHLRFLCLKSRTVWTCCLDSSLHPPGLPLCCLAAVALPESGQWLPLCTLRAQPPAPVRPLTLHHSPPCLGCLVAPLHLPTHL